jgi:hypothetical protein
LMMILNYGGQASILDVPAPRMPNRLPVCT